MIKINFILLNFILLITSSLVIGQTVTPILEFPQPGLDDFSAYSGYKTKFYRDSEKNTLQISIDKNTGRVINLWADAANESISFSIRDTSGNPVEISWGSADAVNSVEGKMRYLQYSLISKSSHIDIGLFLLGTMRIERDFRYQNRYTLPLNSDTVFKQNELTDLISNIKRLPDKIQKEQISALNASAINTLYSRLIPSINYFQISSQKGILIEQPYFDGKYHLSLEISIRDKNTEMKLDKNMVHIKNSTGNPTELYIKIGTNSPALTPLTRDDIFNENFLNYYERNKSGYFSLLARNNNLNGIEKDSLNKFKRMERQIKSLELLSSKEKLMAGLPNFATYFGRDMMMSALMMEPIWKVSMLENVISSVLKKLRPDGNVSHEEGLEGQAIRENAGLYNSLMNKYFSFQKIDEKDSILLKAVEVLKNLSETTENYRMIDDDFQLPVLAAHYILHNEISSSQKISFLKRKIDNQASSTVLSSLLSNLIYITNEVSDYIKNPDILHLVSFMKVGSNWQSASWRDSQAGYANGRFAMDVNVIWVPKALESLQVILNFLKENNFPLENLTRLNPAIRNSMIEEFYNDPEKLKNGISLWQKAAKYFWVNLPENTVKNKIEEKMSWMPSEDRMYWEGVLKNNREEEHEIKFLTLSLDGKGKQIDIENTDPATSIFLNNFTAAIIRGAISADSVLDLIKVFTLHYPAGLFIDSLGVLVANDTYASKGIWETFKHDRYHSPYVVWGREMNLIFLGLSKNILDSYDKEGKLKDESLNDYVNNLKKVLKKVHFAVEKSGLKYNELWGYRIAGGRLYPQRYETTSDIQLWNITNLSAEYLMNQIVNLK